MEEMRIKNSNDADIPNQDANLEQECGVKVEGMHVLNTNDADIQMEDMKT